MTDYFVCMIDYGRRGLQAVVEPEMTKRNVIERIQSGEYQNIAFIHHIHDGVCEVVTDEILSAAQVEVEPELIDHQAARFEHARDLRKHEVV